MALTDCVNLMKSKVENADRGKMKGVNAVFQFELSGDGGGTFHVNVAGEKVEVNGEPHDNPNVTIAMSAADYISMLEGKLNATSAFMAGKLKVKGDMSLAMKLQALVG